MSNQTLKVGALSAGRGEKRYGVNEFLVQGQPYRLPMWLINGNLDGPALVVTGGVHAAEYASIAAALDFGRSLDPRNLRGRLIVVPVMNMPAFTARSIYVCPLDGRNRRVPEASMLAAQPEKSFEQCERHRLRGAAGDHVEVAHQSVKPVRMQCDVIGRPNPLAA